MYAHNINYHVRICPIFHFESFHDHMEDIFTLSMKQYKTPVPQTENSFKHIIYFIAANLIYNERLRRININSYFINNIALEYILLSRVSVFELNLNSIYH